MKLNCEKSNRYHISYSQTGLGVEGRFISDLDAISKMKKYEEIESLIKWDD